MHTIYRIWEQITVASFSSSPYLSRPPCETNVFFFSFHRDSNFPQILQGFCLETSLLTPAMMPRGSPAAHALPCSEPLSCVAISDASCRSRCGSAPSSVTKRVLVNWPCGKGLLSYIVCVKLLLLWAVVNLLKIYGRFFTVGVEGKH